MAIPHLYRNVTLTSYDRIRYRGELPEGWGYGSPFSMGINTLITRAHASSLVQSLTLRGDWNEPELEEYSKIGRVPDATMMLNTSVRAALERMKNLESFRFVNNRNGILEKVIYRLL
jgi:thymidylate kinase